MSDDPREGCRRLIGDKNLEALELEINVRLKGDSLKKSEDYIRERIEQQLEAEKEHGLLSSDVDTDEIIDKKWKSCLRNEIYFSVSLAAMSRGGHELFDSSWTGRRDTAYRNVQKAIKKLASVLEERKLQGAVKGLEKELAKLLTAKYVNRPTGPDELSANLRPIDFGASLRAKLLSQNRVSLGWVQPKGGRATPWKDEAIRYLLQLHMSKNTADALADAAGLSGKTPVSKED